MEKPTTEKLAVSAASIKEVFRLPKKGTINSCVKPRTGGDVSITQFLSNVWFFIFFFQTTVFLMHGSHPKKLTLLLYLML